MEKNYYLMTFNEDWADEHDVPALACMTEEQFAKWKMNEQEAHAYLGNSGDGFMVHTEGWIGQEFIDENYVRVTIVNENFYKTFKEAGLSSLSLSGIFSGW